MKQPEMEFGTKSDQAVMFHFLAAMLVSNTGRNAYFVCIIWGGLTSENDARVVPFLLFASTLSQFLVSGISGHIADVADRRYLVMGMDAARAVIVALTGYAVLADIGVTALILSAALYSAADRGYLTAMQSVIPGLPRSAVTANSASYLMMQSGTFLGAALAGFLLNFLSYGAALSLISSMFILSGAFLGAKRSFSFNKNRTETGDFERPKYFSSIGPLIENKLFLPTLCYSFSFGVGIFVNALLAVYVLNELNGNAVLFSKLESAWALGGVLICLVLAAGSGSALLKPGQTGFLFFSGIALVLLWIIPLRIPVAILLVLLGVTYNLSRIGLDVHVQHNVHPAFIGRARGAINSIATGLGLLIYVLIAMVGDAMLPSHILAGYGVCAIIAAVTFMIASNSRPECNRSGRD
ncbi:MFS transporter [Brucella intermedia]|uniref:MFS transporter n=1 Tax=Brucella TaxID=234 RepID=UPI0009461FDC|nr:MFS transporter [Brucella intermedia]